MFKRLVRGANGASPSSSARDISSEKGQDNIEAYHAEASSTSVGPPSKFKVSKAGDGDVAMELFSSPGEVHEPIDPVEEAKLVRKIDFMILPWVLRRGDDGVIGAAVGIS